MNYNIKALQHKIENIRANIAYLQKCDKDEDLIRKNLNPSLQNLLLRRPCEPDTAEELIIQTTAPYTFYLYGGVGKQNKGYYDRDDINAYYERKKCRHYGYVVYNLKPEYYQQRKMRLHVYRYHYKPATLIKHLEYILHECEYDIKEYYKWVVHIKIHSLEYLLHEYREKAKFCETCGA